MTVTVQNQQKFKVHLTGADPYQWALDEDLKQTEISVSGFTELCTRQDADIIHSVYWENLLKLPEDILKSKKIICNLAGEWGRYERDFGERFRSLIPLVDLWIVRSEKAKQDLVEKNLNAILIPYTVNTDIFKPLSDTETKKWYRKYKLPQDTYLIGNFMRDSNAGKLKTPKLVKGPDIFVDILDGLYQKHKNICAVLAGPRRHWIRSALKKRGIPYRYIGWQLPFEDMRINTMNREKLNTLYNCLNLTVTSSRSEAGPHAILEAGASKCPQISTPVGIAPDVLLKTAIYETPEDAVRLIEDDIGGGTLSALTNETYERIRTNHIPTQMYDLYRNLYGQVWNT